MGNIEVEHIPNTWKETLEILKKDRQFSEFGSLPEATGISKEALLDRLLETLRIHNYSDKDLNDIASVCESAHNSFNITPGHEKRESGDETITHPLWMTAFISERITCDKDVIMATLLHDSTEDTAMTLEEVQKITNPETAELVDILSKVRTKKIIKTEVDPEDNIGEKRQKEAEEKQTQMKLLDAFEKDIRAFIIKGADVIHNQMTSDFMPKEKREPKAKLALDFYEPILRRLGFTDMADMIGDYSLRSVEIDKYSEIKRRKEKFNKVMIPIIHKFINPMLEPANFGNDLLIPGSVEIKSPSIYQAYQEINKGTSTTNECFMPYAEVVFNDDKELFQWHRMLRKNYTLKSQSSNIDQILDSGNPMVDRISLGNKFGKEIAIDFRLSTKNSLVKPAHLFIDGINLDNGERNLAIHRLSSIINYYRQELSSHEGDVVESIKEAAKRGSIEVFGNDNKLLTVPQGSTVMDFAFIIGKNLGKDAASARIYKKDSDGIWKQVSGADTNLSAIISENDKIVIETSKQKVISPQKYESVTTNKAITDISGWINETLEEIGLTNSEVQELYKGKNISKIYSLISDKLKIMNPEKRKILNEFIHSIEIRGTDLIKQLYKSKRGKKLDSNIKSVFNNELYSRFEGLDAMYFYLGLTPLPFRDGDFLEKWQESENPEFESIDLNNRLVRELIKFRDTRVTMLVSIPSIPGVVEKIGDLARNANLNILIIRNTVENKPRKGESTLIEVVFENGDIKKVTKTMAGLKNIDTYRVPGFKITFGYSKDIETELSEVKE